MTTRVTLPEALKGMARPMSCDGAIDPFRIKQSPKFSPVRLAWTLQNRWLERRARREASAALPVDSQPLAHLRSDRGAMLEDTSVTATQLELLLAAQTEAGTVNPDIAEIGSFRGATTASFAQNTQGKVFAIDPFAGYGGSEQEYARFRERTGTLSNVVHLRKTSGEAAHEIADHSIGMVFIDGVHDFSNSWFDYCAWADKVVPGGMIAFHDVDDHPGVRLAVRNLIEQHSGHTIWAYCPNLIIFRKELG